MRSSSSTMPGTALFGLFLLSQVLLLVGVLWLPSEVMTWSLGLVLGVSYLVLMVLHPWTVVPLIVATTALDITGQLVKETPIGIPITGFHVTLGLMGMSVLVNAFLRRRTVFPEFELKVPLAILFNVMALSLTYTPNFVDATLGVARTLFLIIFLYLTQVTIDSRRAVDSVVLSIAVALVGGSILAIVQTATEQFYLPASFVIAVGANLPRAAGTFHNPNTFATFLMCGTVLLISILMTCRVALWRKFLLWLAVALGLAGLAVTFSRANWVATGVGVATILVLTKNVRYAVYGAIGALAAILATKEFVPIADHILERFVSIFTLFQQFGEAGRASGSGRVYFALAGFEMFLDHPLLGAGWRAFPVLFDQYKSMDFPHWIPTKESHTLFANILAELGLVGIIASTWIVVRTLRAGLRGVKEIVDPYLRGVMFGLVAAFIGFQVSLSFTADFGNNYLWFFTGLIFAVNAIDRTQKNS